MVDASIAVLAFAHHDERGRRARAALSARLEWMVPEHWPVEVFSAIRGLNLGGALTDSAATHAVRRLRQASIETVATDILLPQMWAIRHNVSAYDAPYVALAGTHDLTLITADGPLARAAVSHCRVELV